MTKELEYFQEIIKVDEEALTLANKEKSKKRDVMLHRQWLNKRKNIIEQGLKENEQYKSIEKKLGINLKLLPTLLKIKKGDKIYVIDETLVEAEVTDNSLVNGKLMVFSHYGYKGITYTPVCYYSEYGKTWALTKKELL